jgi:hypothetical protein
MPREIYKELDEDKPPCITAHRFLLSMFLRGHLGSRLVRWADVVLVAAKQIVCPGVNWVYKNSEKTP